MSKTKSTKKGIDLLTSKETSETALRYKLRLYLGNVPEDVLNEEVKKALAQQKKEA